MKQFIKRTAVIGAITVLLFPTIASAHDGEHATTDEASDSRKSTVSKESESRRVEEQRKHTEERLQQLRENREKLTEKKTEIKERLTATKKKICEEHQTRVNSVMKNMNNRRQNTFDRITRVSEAVQTYVSNHNLSVANYEDLVAAVTATKSLAQTSMSSQLTVPSLDCDGDHPKADVTDFKTKRANSIDAMKAYREAVKALIKAVKDTAKTSESGDAS